MNQTPTKYESNLYIKNKGGLGKSSPYIRRIKSLHWYGLVRNPEDSGTADFASFKEIENFIRLF